MELAVGVLVRLLHALDVLDDVQRAKQVDVHHRGVPHQPQHQMRGALGGMNGDVQALEPGHEVIELLFLGVFLENHDHGDRRLLRS